jgi:uncharacterized protein YjbI with pentapeptide repeats
MALPSYMSRREGRYYLQVRLARPLAALIGVPLYRASLRTCDYRQARLRLAECLAWIYRMNDSVDYPDLIEKNVAQLVLSQTQLRDALCADLGVQAARISNCSAIDGLGL